MFGILGIIKVFFSEKRRSFIRLSKLLGYYPRKWDLYELAFIHRSASIFLADGTSVNNERLEFLGDAVLDSVIAEYLFHEFPNKDEGFLSKMRSKIVKRKNLNQLALKIGMKEYIVSQSINANGGKHIYGNAFEALVGAIYIDVGYKKTKKFLINRILKKHINLSELELRETDYKSRIIEWAQKARAEISFESQEEYTSKEHTPIFISKVLVANELMGLGKGFSKKEAEQNAAEQAYNAINLDSPDCE